jgi:hypothetical protein
MTLFKLLVASYEQYHSPNAHCLCENFIPQDHIIVIIERSSKSREVLLLYHTTLITYWHVLQKEPSPASVRLTELVGLE